MTSNKVTACRVDYYYGKGGARTRCQLGISVWQHLNGATTENSVLNYLRKKHPGYEIELMSIDWKP